MCVFLAKITKFREYPRKFAKKMSCKNWKPQSYGQNRSRSEEVMDGPLRESIFRQIVSWYFVSIYKMFCFFRENVSSFWDWFLSKQHKKKLISEDGPIRGFAPLNTNRMATQNHSLSLSQDNLAYPWHLYYVIQGAQIDL